MSKRRGKGEGSIFWRDDKERWVAEVNLPDGRTKSHMTRTKREAQEWLREALLAAKQGMLITGPGQTVGQYLERWLTDTAKARVKLKTYTTYAGLLHNHAIPELGKVKLDALTPQHLQKFYADEQKQGLAPRSVGHVHRVLHRALKDAMRWNLIPRNPCDLVDPPRVPKRQTQTLDEDGIVRFIRAAQGSPLGALYILAATTGLREGELLALRWQDIEAGDTALQVHRTVWYSREHGFVFTEPKSKTSRRRVDLTDMARAALTRRREVQAGQKLLAGEAWEENNLVVCNELGQPLKVYNFYYAYKKLLKQAGLPSITFHALRHSFASQLLTQGEHPRVVQEILGHSTIAITMDLYSHVSPTLQREAVDRLNRRLSIVNSLVEQPQEALTVR